MSRLVIICVQIRQQVAIVYIEFSKALDVALFSAVNVYVFYEQTK